MWSIIFPLWCNLFFLQLSKSQTPPNLFLTTSISFVLYSFPLPCFLNSTILLLLFCFFFFSLPSLESPKKKNKRNKERKQGNGITGMKLWDSHSTKVFTNFNPCHLHSSLLNSISTRNMMRKIAETIFPHQYPTHTHTDTNTHTLTHTHTHIYIC